MSTQADLLAEIEAFLRERKPRIAASTFGLWAVNDGKFIRRLRSGGKMTLATADRVREFLREQREAPKSQKRLAAIPKEQIDAV